MQDLIAEYEAAEEPDYLNPAESGKSAGPGEEGGASAVGDR